LKNLAANEQELLKLLERWLDLAAGPRRQVPAVLEPLRIGDPGAERTGGHRANREDRLEPWAQLARLVLLAAAISALAISISRSRIICRGQALIALITGDRRQLRQPEQASCCDDAELAQVPAHGVDELRALADQLRAGGAASTDLVDRPLLARPPRRSPPHHPHTPCRA
jgi:hypothetical protein